MALSKKFDPFRDHQAEYQATEEPRLVDTQPGTYLTITGKSEPGGEDFKARVRALYKTVQLIERHRRGGGHEFVIGKLEALWWEPPRKQSENGSPSFHWKLMVRVPDFITDQDLTMARKQARSGMVDDVWLERIDEGRCVQVLHMGPLEREQDTFTRMEDFVRQHGLAFDGFHHEIYLTNPDDVPPEKLRTILRHRVVPATGAARIH